jgi:hypothetical protein
MRATLGRWRKGEGGWGEDEGNSRKIEEGRRWEGAEPELLAALQVGQGSWRGQNP